MRLSFEHLTALCRPDSLAAEPTERGYSSPRYFVAYRRVPTGLHVQYLSLLHWRGCDPMILPSLPQRFQIAS